MVSAVVCTRNRYDTTLSQCLQAIAMQTYPISELFIYDDSDNPQDLRNREPYKQLFILLQQKGISFKVVFGYGKGQVYGHKLSVKECKTEFIYRVDDDCIPEPKCLEILMEHISSDKSVGAVGGLVLDVANKTTSKLASSKIRDIYLGLNEQWFVSDREAFEVDHLYSTFVYRRGDDYYPSNLSRIGHREETIMTYGLKRAGYKLIVEPRAITWHLKASNGGIRDGYKEMFDHDEAIFAGLMKEWAVETKIKKIITLDVGLGDTYAFRTILPRLMEIHRDNLCLAVCYPDVFRDFDVEIISIAEAHAGNHRDGIYKFMWERNWNKNLVEAYEACYLA